MQGKKHTIQKTVSGSNLLPSTVHLKEAFPLPFKASLLFNLIGEKDIRLRPAAVQELTSLSILGHEFLLCKNIAAAWNQRHLLCILTSNVFGNNLLSSYTSLSVLIR
ncbi:hypothetical protein DWB79_02535 [Treponema medium]|uniref:Uncharacterized protein n=1 Tax=Treponema medium TaxID=58231 RepID=A0ABX7LUI2_TREMD|nr:hypothetical protein [Treponema medium]QSH96651.1 hypothetical protein DWB79_02535 [Treponema medium]